MKKYQCVMQDGIKDCGVCSLLTIIKTYGGDVSKEYLRLLTNTTKDGTNAYYLFQAAKTIGFDVKALKGNIKDLDNNSFPCIAHVIKNKNYKHFVVIHKVQKDKIIIADPAEGIKTIKIDEFNSISTNQFLLFIPNKKIPHIQSNNNFKSLLISNLLNYKSVFISIFLFSFFYTIINIITSYNFQFIIEDAINVGSKNNIYFISFIMLFLVILKCINDYMRNNLFNYINHKLDVVLIKDIFKHILSLPYAYYKNRTTGEIISRINDLNDVKETISSIFIYVFVDSILIVFVLISLCFINVYLTILSFLIILLYFIIIRIFNSSLNKRIKLNGENVAGVNSYMIESIENASSIKNLCIENEIINNLESKYNKYLNVSYSFNKIFNIENFLKNLVNSIGLILIVFLGSIFVLEDKMTVGELITYNSLIIYFLEPLKNIINSDIYLKRSKVALNRIIELYSINKENLDIDKKYTKKVLKGNIDINNLSYSYNGRIDILTNINLNIKMGEKVLICGNSGSGKSTLAKIIMKYLDVSNNMIYLDDKDINNYNLFELRRDICYVSQNEFLFTDSVYENITLKRYIDYDKFLDISKLTCVDRIVSNNFLGYDMLLEENGFNISGGERQRIILARSLLKESSVYILDESLSEVDIETERNILNNLFDKYKGKTIIVISHRFNNNDLFDKVLTLNNGVLNGYS